MKAALLGTCIPLGYILCGLLTARAILSHYVKPNGTYDDIDDAPLMATFGGIFWPVVLPGHLIYRMIKRGVGLGWIVDPKSVRDRKRRERERAAKWAQEKAEIAQRQAQARAEDLAKINGLPWPKQNPFIDDTGNVNHNPVGRPPMSERPSPTRNREW